MLLASRLSSFPQIPCIHCPVLQWPGIHRPLTYTVLLQRPPLHRRTIDLLHRLRGQFSYIALCVSPNCPSHVTQLDGRLSHIVNVIIGQMLSDINLGIWEL